MLIIRFTLQKKTSNKHSRSKSEPSKDIRIPETKPGTEIVVWGWRNRCVWWLKLFVAITLLMSLLYVLYAYLPLIVHMIHDYFVPLKPKKTNVTKKNAISEALTQRTEQIQELHINMENETTIASNNQITPSSIVITPWLAWTIEYVGSGAYSLHFTVHYFLFLLCMFVSALFILWPLVKWYQRLQTCICQNYQESLLVLKQSLNITSLNIIDPLLLTKTKKKNATIHICPVWQQKY